MEIRILIIIVAIIRTQEMRILIIIILIYYFEGTWSLCYPLCYMKLLDPLKALIHINSCTKKTLTGKAKRTTKTRDGNWIIMEHIRECMVPSNSLYAEF